MPHQYFVSISSISGDGALVAFDSTASNLVDLDTNNATDVFLYDPSGLPSGGPSCTYCVAGLTTHGCTPAISGSGVPSASAGSGFSVAVNQVEGQRLGIFFMGEGPSFAPFSSGSTSYRCVAGPFRRLPPQSTGGTNGACDGALSIDWNTTCGSFYLAGAAVFVQLYFRDPPAVNLSNALQFIVQP
jgi:hypothetical protein